MAKLERKGGDSKPAPKTEGKAPKVKAVEVKNIEVEENDDLAALRAARKAEEEEGISRHY